MSKVGVTGVSAKTPASILFGAGTIHKNLTYDSAQSAWNFDKTIVGATSGGSKLSIKPKIHEVKADGVSVKMKGLDQKNGETATLEINFLELNKEIIKTATLGQEGASEDKNYDLITSKGNIVTGDYWDNVAFVGTLLESDKPVVVILENAICTSGLEVDPKDDNESVAKLVFECASTLDGSPDTLPWKIYTPKSSPVAV